MAALSVNDYLFVRDAFGVARIFDSFLGVLVPLRECWFGVFVVNGEFGWFSANFFWHHSSLRVYDDSEIFRGYPL